jgi:GMP synthase (glutamine-hydrolysing)
MRPRVLCVLHQRHSITGQVGVALRQLGVQVQTVRPLLGQRLPRDLHGFDGLIVFGGPMSANDDHLPGIRVELQLIERWLAADRPLWGICLGAQMMARVLGSPVFVHPEDQVEIGWYPVRPIGRGRQFLGGLSHVYQWHREGFEMPKGAERVAIGAVDSAFREQAFMLGQHALGTQFHPEMHPRMMHRWLTRAGHMLELEGARSLDQHLAGMKRYYPKQSQWLKRTLAHWLAPVIARNAKDFGASADS